MLPGLELLLVAVQINLLLCQFTFPPGQLLGGEPLLLLGFSLFQDERLLRLVKLRPFLRNGSEGLLVAALELLRMLLYVNSRPRDKRFPGLKLRLMGAVE